MIRSCRFTGLIIPTNQVAGVESLTAAARTSTFEALFRGFHILIRIKKPHHEIQIYAFNSYSKKDYNELPDILSFITSTSV